MRVAGRDATLVGLVARLRRQGQSLGPLRRRHGRHRRRLPRRAVILAIDQGTSGTTCLVVDGELRGARPRLRRARGAVSAARLGRAGPRRRSGRACSAPPREALAGGGSSARVTSRRSASPTSARRRSLWERRRAGRSSARSSGRTVARPALPRASGRADPRATGLVTDPYFSATKLEWLLADGAAGEELAAGTVDSWLVWKLTGGAVHVTDPTNASRTMLFDLPAEWDAALLAVRRDRALLP